MKIKYEIYIAVVEKNTFLEKVQNKLRKKSINTGYPFLKETYLPFYVPEGTPVYFGDDKIGIIEFVIHKYRINKNGCLCVELKFENSMDFNHSDLANLLEKWEHVKI